MKKIIVWIAVPVVCSYMGCTAQSLAPTFVGSAGGYANSTSGSLSWSMGETMTETFSATNNQLTQGFQQPGAAMSNSIRSVAAPELHIYPNPVVDKLRLDFSKTGTGTYVAEIFDAQGRKIGTENIYVKSNASEPYILLFNQYPEGSYLITITCPEKNTKTSFKITKS
ncbi:MAG: T9SS type A sorting domain-containing protein [Bacteroidia bacterium]